MAMSGLPPIDPMVTDLSISVTPRHRLEARFTRLNALNPKLAIISHPLGALGGNMDDHVVGLIAETCLAKGYNTLLYNVRGVGNSTGLSIQSVESGVEDLKAVVKYAIGAHPQTSTIVLAGYSWGALITSNCPPPQSFLSTEVEHDIVRCSHILVSYPLGPVEAIFSRWWLPFFSGSAHLQAVRNLTVNHRTRLLLLYGGADSFTASDRYARWVEDLKAYRNQHSRVLDSSATGTAEASGSGDTALSTRLNSSPPAFKVLYVPDANHFWTTSRSLAKLETTIGEWLDRLDAGDFDQPV